MFSYCLRLWVYLVLSCALLCYVVGVFFLCVCLCFCGWFWYCVLFAVFVRVWASVCVSVLLFLVKVFNCFFLCVCTFAGVVVSF